MNSDTVKGKIDDAAGRARRQLGEWTGKTEEEIKGAAQQVKGKAEKVVGKVRDAIHDAAHSATHDTNNTADPDDIDDHLNREDLKRVNQK
jgi:uncharacterized protein YjbJ (UPF0337 family)